MQVNPSHNHIVYLFVYFRCLLYQITMLLFYFLIATRISSLLHLNSVLCKMSLGWSCADSVLILGSVFSVIQSWVTGDDLDPKLSPDQVAKFVLERINSATGVDINPLPNSLVFISLLSLGYHSLMSFPLSIIQFSCQTNKRLVLISL